MNQKKTYGLFIVSPVKFADKEYFIPKKIFEENNINIKTASINKKHAVSMQNVQIKIDLTLDELKINKFDFILLVGGFGVKQHLWDNLILNKIIKDAYNVHKIIVGAICLAPVILARAGILNNKKATVFRRIDALKEFKKYNIEYINSDVIEVENIVTANSPRSSEAFAKTILNKLIKNNENQ